MENKLFLGIVGPIGSGKDTAGSYLKIYHNASVLVSSELLGTILSLLKLDPEKREFLQKLPIILRETFGSTVITDAMIENMRETKKAISVWNGVRFPSDVEGIRSLPNSAIIGITANPIVRFNRIKERGQKSGEKDLTWEQFEYESLKPTEQATSHILKYDSDIVLDNSGTVDELHQKIDQFIKDMKKKFNII